MNVMKWTSKILTTVLTCMFVLVLVFAISSKISGGIPSIMGYQVMNVLSGSMEPGIQTGSIIVIKPSGDTASFKAGEVITFRSQEQESMIITHRIDKVLSEGGQIQYVTKGDNNDSIDSIPVTPTQIVGKYIGVTIPFVGYIIDFSKSKEGIISLMIIPGALLIISQIISLWRLISKMDDKDKTGQGTPDTETQLANDPVVH